VTVLLIATGGTIASKPQPGKGVTVALDGRDLLATVEALDTTDVDVLDVTHGASWNFELAFMGEVAVLARDALAGGQADAIVITHGTDTLEETAYLVWLLAAPTSVETGPVIVTGAMRNAGHPDGDGPRNLRDAFAAARSSTVRDAGVLVCMNGELHDPRVATKTHAHQLDSFRSPGTDVVGTVRDGVVTMTAPIAPLPDVVLPHAPPIDPAVAVVRSEAGVDPDLVPWLLGRGVHGLVIEGTGAGNVNAALVPGIEAALGRGVLVVVTTRALDGAVAPVYGGPGGGHTIISMGVIPGGALTAAKARLALGVALAVDPEPDAVAQWMAEVVHAE
jgi:L-asparaginase